MSNGVSGNRKVSALVTRRRAIAGLGGLSVAVAVATIWDPPTSTVSNTGTGALAAGTPTPIAGTAVPGAEPSHELVEFRDPGSRFALSYPRAWERLDTTDPQVALLAAQDDRYSLQVRVTELRNPIGDSQLPAARAVTDRIVMANPTVTLREEPERISLGGLPGLFYLYTFADPRTGQLGAHSHFFVFRGAVMIALLFQAVPATAFRDAAPVFDQVTGSFRTL